jgi:succinate dehydrogenase assembly factor 2
MNRIQGLQHLSRTLAGPSRIVLRPIILSKSLHVTPKRLADPFVLPLSDPELAAVASRRSHPNEGSEEYPLPQPLDRTGEDEKTLRARLVYQTRKRGTLETDLLLSTFARDFLPTMDVEEMRQFDKVRRDELIDM